LARHQEKIAPAQIEPIVTCLMEKSQGNFWFLESIDRAFSMVHVPIDASMVLDVPSTLDDIYAQAFEEKFGAGRKRMWLKTQPVLEMICAVIGLRDATFRSIFVTEKDVQKVLSMTTEDCLLVRRALEDIVSCQEDVHSHPLPMETQQPRPSGSLIYRFTNKAWFDWLFMHRKDQIDLERGRRHCMSLVVAEGHPPKDMMHTRASSSSQEKSRHRGGEHRMNLHTDRGANDHPYRVTKDEERNGGDNTRVLSSDRGRRSDIRSSTAPPPRSVHFRNTMK
jgi:hypothetical protein